MDYKSENETVEFKKSTGELKEGIISLSSMLNKNGERKLYFGVANDATIVGQDIIENTLRKISKEIADKIIPKVTPTINQINYQGKKLLRLK